MAAISQPNAAPPNAGPLKVWTERDGALLRLRLARPKANIVDAEMIAALHGAFEAHRGKTGILAALVDAAGPHFSFGASVEEHLAERCAAMLASLHALLLAMLEWPVPILVAVKGQCLGGGLELAMGGSLIFAAGDAKLGQPEIQLGVFAPAASCLLPPRIGQAAGLVTAAGAAGLGAKVALIEKHWMGGDCLNVGCVPSKTLIRAARAAHDARSAARFGVRVPRVEVDFAAVM
ncbi:MAG: enoyl-CoA hydratase-related protein, partial [Burkholderiales bacterium]